MRGLRTVFAVLLAVAAAAPHAAEQTLDRIVAVIDDEIVTQRELAAAIARFRRMLEERRAEMPSEKVLA
ncbi:MAG: molecular chaperone SurA, partial [Gammaproteobacteria bacterium]|nr:molecular chaperone SurA [Gammaproteobacteria bacterium]